MNLVKSYILPRLLQWLVVIVVGITVTFLIPRLLPTDPVEQSITRLAGMQMMDPRAVADFQDALRDLYGLQGTVFEQYVQFWRRLVQGDLGPSLGSFPTPVTTIIRNALPWTVGLLGTSVLVSWLLGVVLGTLAGYYSDSLWAKTLDKVLITVYPIPYYILALTLVILFSYYLPIFPLVGGGRGQPAFTFTYLRSVVRHGFLPAVSLIVIATAFRFIMAKALTSRIISSDYVTYARIGGLPDRRIISSYVMRNSLLPQITDLGLSLGAVFEGALITEVVFSYPGIGYTIFTAIAQTDFNLLLGVTLFSIVGIATAALFVDLLYPLFDPRIRYG